MAANNNNNDSNNNGNNNHKINDFKIYEIHINSTGSMKINQSYGSGNVSLYAHLYVPNDIDINSDETKTDAILLIAGSGPNNYQVLQCFFVWRMPKSQSKNTKKKFKKEMYYLDPPYTNFYWAPLQDIAEGLANEGTNYIYFLFFFCDFA